MRRIVPYVLVIMLVIVALIGFWFDRPRDEEQMGNVKVGLLLNGPADDKSWNQSHFEGLQQAAKELKLEVILAEKVPENKESRAVIDRMVKQDCKAIIATSFGYGPVMKQAAEDYPQVSFLHATGLDYSKNLTSFFGRMYQVRYLSGIVAGLQSRSGVIGYVAAMDIPEVVRGINAFTLGVRSVAPQARVYVKYVKSWNDDKLTADATYELITKHHQIDVLTMHSNSLESLKIAEQRNIGTIGYNFDNAKLFPRTYLTAAVWRWDSVYLPMLRDCLQGGYEGNHFWFGIEKNVAGLSPFTRNVHSDVRQRIIAARQRLEKDAFDVFYGPVYDNKGQLRVKQGENLSDGQLLHDFDWYVDGVVVDE
ncbi:MAG: BMP family ABC transporter substrate-binding protein [Phascolarctobacterium sp.]